MIQFFRKNDVVNMLALLPYVIIVRIYSLLHPVAYDISEAQGVISTAIFKGLYSLPLLQSIIAIILIYIQAIFINIQSNNHRLYQSQSGFAGMLYILLISYLPGLQLLTPALIAMTFILLSTYSVFQVYKQNNATSHIFNSALLIGIATLIYPPALLLALILFIELAILRSFSFKEKLQFIIGYGVIFWIFGVVFYYFGLFDNSLFTSLGFPGIISAVWPLGLYELIIVVLILACIMFSILNYYSYMKKKGIEVRKKINYFYWGLLAALISTLFFQHINVQPLIIVGFSLAVFFTMNFSQAKNSYRIELIHFMMFLAVFLSLFHSSLLPSLS